MTDISFFDYDLPEELIAQNPCESRDSSRLLVVSGMDISETRATPGKQATQIVASPGTPSPETPSAEVGAGASSEVSLCDKTFNDILELLKPGSVIVFNDTQVFPARLRARRATGGRVEVLLTRQLENPPNKSPHRKHCSPPIADVGSDIWCESWQAMIKPTKRLKKGEYLELLGPGGNPIPMENCRIQIGDKGEDGESFIKLVGATGRWESGLALCNELGETPLPPYIRRPAGERETDRERYQTVYARIPGAVAAPTAGLHFSRELLKRIRKRGVNIAYVTLHVGPGTFRPIKTQNIAEHVMHSEWFHLSEETVSVINRARAGGGSVVAVGTTTVRVLESCCDTSGCLTPQSGETRLFIYPGFEFRVVDALVTNFHLPRSSLLLLVAAFAGEKRILRAYEHAVRQRYRFYSYGDAMFLFRA